MRKITTFEVQLEVRTCPGCGRTFRAAPTSRTIYDSRFCERYTPAPITEPVRISPPDPVTLQVRQLYPHEHARTEKRKRSAELQFHF